MSSPTSDRPGAGGVAPARSWLQALPATEPPPALDAAVLHAARTAAHVQAPRPPGRPATWWLRWLTGARRGSARWGGNWGAGWPVAGLVGSAAAALLAIHVVLSPPPPPPPEQAREIRATPQVAAALPADQRITIAESASRIPLPPAPAAPAVAPAASAVAPAAPALAPAAPGAAPAAPAAALAAAAADPLVMASAVPPRAAPAMNMLRSAPLPRTLDPASEPLPGDGAACETRLRQLLGKSPPGHLDQLLRDCQLRYPDWQPPPDLLQAIQATFAPASKP